MAQYLSLAISIISMTPSTALAHRSDQAQRPLSLCYCYIIRLGRLLQYITKMHLYNLLSIVAASLLACVAATSTYDVTNYCNDKKWLTLSTNAQGVTNYNDELPSGTSRHYEIVGDHSLAIANNTDYWSPSTYKLVLGTNSAGGTLYYAVGQANGYPLSGKGFSFLAKDCPGISAADGQTRACGDNNVSFRMNLCI